MSNRPFEMATHAKPKLLLPPLNAKHMVRSPYQTAVGSAVKTKSAMTVDVTKKIDFTPRSRLWAAKEVRLTFPVQFEPSLNDCRALKQLRERLESHRKPSTIHVDFSGTLIGEYPGRDNLSVWNVNQDRNGARICLFLDVLTVKNTLSGEHENAFETRSFKELFLLAFDRFMCAKNKPEACLEWRIFTDQIYKIQYAYQDSRIQKSVDPAVTRFFALLNEIDRALQTFENPKDFKTRGNRFRKAIVELPDYDAEIVMPNKTHAMFQEKFQRMKNASDWFSEIQNTMVLARKVRINMSNSLLGGYTEYGHMDDLVNVGRPMSADSDASFGGDSAGSARSVSVDPWGDIDPTDAVVRTHGHVFFSERMLADFRFKKFYLMIKDQWAALTRTNPGSMSEKLAVKQLADTFNTYKIALETKINTFLKAPVPLVDGDLLKDLIHAYQDVSLSGHYFKFCVLDPTAFSR